LLLDTITRTARADPAIFALLVEGKDEAAMAFYRHLGFQLLASRAQSLFLPIAEAVQRLSSQ